MIRAVLARKFNVTDTDEEFFSVVSEKPESGVFADADSCAAGVLAIGESDGAGLAEVVKRCFVGQAPAGDVRCGWRVRLWPREAREVSEDNVEDPLTRTFNLVCSPKIRQRRRILAGLRRRGGEVDADTDGDKVFTIFAYSEVFTEDARDFFSLKEHIVGPFEGNLLCVGTESLKGGQPGECSCPCEEVTTHGNKGGYEERLAGQGAPLSATAASACALLVGDIGGEGRGVGGTVDVASQGCESGINLCEPNNVRLVAYVCHQ